MVYNIIVRKVESMKDITLKKKVSFNKSGTGGITPKLNLNNSWLDDMGVNEEDKGVILTYNELEKKIIIEKEKEK